MREAHDMNLRGKFTKLLFEGESTAVFSFQTVKHGVVEVGIQKAHLVPEFNSIYDLGVILRGVQRVTRNGFIINENRLRVLHWCVVTGEAE